jgi:L-cysteine S-thiosulfotransferase
MAGSAPSPRKSSAERLCIGVLAAALAVGAATLVERGRAEEAAQGKLRPYTIVGDAIPAPLTGAKGDPERGRAIVVNRQVGLCLLCHSGPFPEERFQGNFAPDLSGAGKRSTEAQLRLRIVDSSRINPASIMPAYHRTEGLVRVGPAWRGKPVLSAEQIEDVVAFLVTLKD